jgi:hypothetical protein
MGLTGVVAPLRVSDLPGDWTRWTFSWNVRIPAGIQIATFAAGTLAMVWYACTGLRKLKAGDSGRKDRKESMGITDAFLRDGVAKFVAGGSLKDDLAISRLIDSARVLGRELARGATNNRIGESTLASIRSRICPLFPFC